MHTEYSINIKNKLKKYSRNYHKQFRAENIKYGRKSARSETKIRGFGLQPSILEAHKKTISF